MSAPAIYNTIIKQGVPYWRQLILKEADGSPLDLTGAVYAGNIRGTDGSLIGSFTFTPDPDPTTGIVSYGLEDTTTLPSTAGLHALPYDIFITPAAHKRICPVEGLIAVEAKQTVLS